MLQQQEFMNVSLKEWTKHPSFQIKIIKYITINLEYIKINIGLLKKIFRIKYFIIKL